MTALAKIAVIGGTGFIGRHLLERYAAERSDPIRVLVHGGTPEWLRLMPQVEPFTGDLLRPSSLAPLLNGVDCVVNLAGQVDPDAEACQRLNLRGMVTLAQACLKHHVRRVIHASSTLVYGNALDVREDAACRPISPYATLKLAAEEILETLLTPQIGLLRLRLSNVYGPRQSKGLMPYLVNRILRREPITIDADGAQVRDFVHVQDAAAAFIKAISTPTCTGILNIGSGQATSIMSLLRLLEEVLEGPAVGHYCPEHTGGERRNTVNVDRAARALGWEAMIRLADGAHTVLIGEEVSVGEGVGP
jgi:UDP-glucose 4-epimerase